MRGTGRRQSGGWRGWAGCLLLVTAALAGCRSQGRSQAKPVIEFTEVPKADPGGPAELDYIGGRATGAQPGQQIVLYAHSGIWWIQPFANQKFTKIQPDATWRNSTHLGTEYAALLVEAGYQPQAKLNALPGEGNGVIAMATTTGKAIAKPASLKVIHFSGYDWTVRAASSDRGGEPSYYGGDNAWTDEKGHLHLRMGMRDGRWEGAEVNLSRSLGFGSYRFVVEDTSRLSASAVLGMFTWAELQPEETRNELDVEISRWGNATGKNAQYVVQPFFVPENVVRFSAPAGVLTHEFRWEPGSASFKTMAVAKTVSQHVFTSGIPAPSNETVHIDLYDFRHSRNGVQPPAEVVVDKFEYLP